MVAEIKFERSKVRTLEVATLQQHHSEIAGVPTGYNRTDFMERISSRQNPIVKRFREIARAGGREWMLLDGEHLLEEALDSGVRIDVAAFGNGLPEGRLATLAARVARAGTTTIAVTDPVLAVMSPVRQSSGVVAIAERRPVTIDQVLERRPLGRGPADAGRHEPMVLMLSQVQDPGNVGAIIRAAEACGATGVVAGEGTADPFGWKALRGAMGSTFRLPVASGHTLADAVGAARAAGLRVFATAARDGTPLAACDLRGPSAILFGGEGAGLPQDLQDASDERLTIPMRPPVESLNVAIAAALVLYEAARQRARQDHVFI
jgi:TrmH family RNA methyltransferase